MNYDLLKIYADLLDDLESSRIATENRIRSLRDVKGMAGSPEEQRLDSIAMGLAEAERKATNELRRAMKAHPLGGWVGAQVGVGEKSAGRLLAAIGDPYVRSDTGEPRTVNQLWAYCGLHVIDGARPRRKKGQIANWSSTAKTQAYLIARSCVYNRESPYRAVYDEAREKAKGKVHSRQCQNTIRPVAGKPQGSNGCGTREHPELGEPGTPWREGHQHAYALGIAAKVFLRDLWREARRAQEQDVAQVDRGPAQTSTEGTTQ